MMIAFFMYGGMIMSIFPRDPGISYEAHFFGALGGVVAALIFWRQDPKLAEKHYQWQDDEPDRDDPLIGDLWRQARYPEGPAETAKPDAEAGQKARAGHEAAHHNIDRHGHHRYH